MDPRLIRYTRATRRFLTASVVFGTLTALLIVAQAWLLAKVISDAFIGHQSLSDLRAPLALLFAVIATRASLGWFTERTADKASSSAKSELRTELIERVAQLGPAGLDGENPGKLTVLATSGVDALDDYFARYLPQLFLSVIVPAPSSSSWLASTGSRR